jgi:tRNA dimethylallyltransferase
MNPSNYQLITILGPTAAGKTKLAAHLAAQINGEIISADSRQVYKQMTLGTGKDYADYLVDGISIPYHLIDIVEPGYKYNVFEFQTDFYKVYQDVIDRQKFPIMCGGSGLYLEAVLNNYKLIAVPVNDELRLQLSGKSLDELTQLLSAFKSLHNTTDVDTIPRAIRAIEIETYYLKHVDVDSDFPKINSLIVGVNIDRNARRQKITKRLKERLDEGMIDEVQHLLEQGLTSDDLVYYGLEYKYVTLYLVGKLSYNQMFEQLETAIHQFAKRQMTWYRRMERNGFKINWVDAFEPIDERVNRIMSWL